MIRKPSLVCAALFLSAGVVAADTPTEAYGRLPLSFEANAGQTDPAVRFLSRGPGYTLFLTPAEAVLRLRGPQEDAVVRLRLAGGKRSPRITGLEPQAARSNYLLGNDPQEWHTGVSHYARVRYESVYPGIDLVYHGNQRQLEYDFILAPGADPKRIRLAFQGADRLTLGAGGELILHTAQGDLVQHSPVVYQEKDGERRTVAGRYVLLGRRRAGFALGRYDRGRPLVIDPVLVHSTLLGGDAYDLPRAIALDSAGNAYITGMTESINFPVGPGSIQTARSGITDAFVTKINPTGTAIVYSTYLGGSGNGSEWGFDVAVDGAGSAYVTGWTDSPTFPGVGPGSIEPVHPEGQEAFVAKIDPTGAAIVYATFLGGRQHDFGLGIAIDGAGNAYVTGGTDSTEFFGVDEGSIQPTKTGDFNDAFVTKINAAGTAVVYSTFLGGSGDDQAWDITVDGQGNAYLIGQTTSATFPGVGPGSLQPANGGLYYDAFVTKINPAGTAIVSSTFLGGDGWNDRGRGIAVDGTGVYLTGTTDSTNFPGVNANSIQPTWAGGEFPGDAFVTKLNPAGTAILYSTYLGGSGFDGCYSIAVDHTGSAYVIGETNSPTFPGVNAGSLQPAYGGGAIDATLTKINPMGTAILFSTYLGGSGADEGLAVALDGAGGIYVTGNTDASDFPGLDASSIQSVPGGLYDGFLTKIGEEKLEFFTVQPCRLIDTRNPAGPLGGPALQPGASRLFPLTGACGVPATAKALSLNVTVTQPTAAGYLQLLPGNQPNLPPVSTLNYSAGQTRANNAIVPLATDGSGSLLMTNGSAGSVHLLLDVNGYFVVAVP